MAQISAAVQKIFRAVPNIGLRASKNQDILSFVEFTNSTTIEKALTEFAARICYNSVKRIGSAPNFVEGILKSGHLSTAEHASLMLPVRSLGGEAFSKTKIFDVNRYFDFPKGYVAGNLRSWLELMAIGDYNPLYEYIVTVFPDVFPSGPYINEVELYEFSEQAPINVPPFESQYGTPNVYLLAVNRGELDVSRRPDTKVINPWVRYTWLVEGVSRSLTHQLVRHRSISVSQESQRYVDFSKGRISKNYPMFILPESWNDEQKAKMQDAYENIAEYYEELRKDGAKKEDARFILPNAASTRLVVSGNLPELLHFLKLRCAKDAQWEIRRLAVEMLRQAFLATPVPELEALMNEYGR